MEFFKLGSGGLLECSSLPRCLAQILLTLQEGEYLPNLRELAERFNASLGSVSAAMNTLEEMGAVTLNRRGRLGTFMEKKSLRVIWKVIENGPLVIALTLPSFLKSEGLATAIFTLLDTAGIETYLIFIRGSLNRLKALRDRRCHAVVTSVLAAEGLCDQREEILLKLPPQSFVTDHRVLYRRDRAPVNPPLRVGIDLDSYDIKYLTEQEFAGADVEYYPMPFVQADRNFEKSPVDVAISNLDHLDRSKRDEIASRPLSHAVQAMVGDRGTSAAIITRAGEPAARILLASVLQPAEIIAVQQKVVAGEMVPRY